MRQHDNLIGQKLATTTRHRVAASVSVRPARALSSSFRAGLNTVDNDAAEAGRRMDFTSITFGTTQSLALPRGSFPRSVSVSYGYQQSRDANPSRSANGIRAHDTSLRTTVEASRSISITPAVGLSWTNVGDTEWDLRHTYSVAGQYRAGGGRWSSSASISNSRLHAGGALQAALSSRYRITSADMVTVSLHSNRVSGLETDAGRFHEHTLSVRWSRSIR
jgi:hypothetical protein